MIWILTMYVNDYNQHGEYFIDAWTSLPTRDQLHEHVKNWFCGPDVDPIDVLLETGGGRQNLEDEWFELRRHR
jgi:hypothetical protein